MRTRVVVGIAGWGRCWWWSYFIDLHIASTQTCAMTTIMMMETQRQEQRQEQQQSNYHIVSISIDTWRFFLTSARARKHKKKLPPLFWKFPFFFRKFPFFENPTFRKKIHVSNSNYDTRLAFLKIPRFERKSTFRIRITIHDSLFWIPFRKKSTFRIRITVHVSLFNNINQFNNNNNSNNNNNPSSPSKLIAHRWHHPLHQDS